MVRGVMWVASIVIVLVAYSVLAPAAVEGVGEAVKDMNVLDDDEEAIIDSYYTAIFVRVPLVAFFGVLVVAAVWYVRRQSTVGRR